MSSRVRVRHVKIRARNGRGSYWSISVDKKIVDTALTRSRARMRAKKIAEMLQ